MTAYPTIFSRDPNASLEKFFSVLSKCQISYIKRKYKDYMFAAVGRICEEEGLTDERKQKYFNLAFGVQHYEDIPEMLYGPIVGFAKVACMNTELSSWVIPFMIWAAGAVILYGLHTANCIAAIVGASVAH